MPIAIAFAKKADVIGFDLNEKKIELYKSGVDPQADAADAKHEYGVDLVDLSEVRDADCLVFAVAHNEFRNLSWKQIDGLFGKCPANEKILIDVKSILDKSEIEELGYSYWRL